MRGNFGPFSVREERLKDRIGDGVFGQHRIDLFNSDVDLVQTLSERFHFLSETLQLSTVDHVVQAPELVGVEEAPVVAR